MRLIDADALREMFPEDYDHPLYHFTGIWAAIGVCHTIDAAPVRRGEWNVTDAWPHKVYCSNCYETIGASTVPGDVEAKCVPRPNFCPNCGADMRKEEHHEPED